MNPFDKLRAERDAAMEENRRLREHMKAAHEAIAEGIKHYNLHYEAELDSIDRWGKWCDEQKDTHGQNFHQGARHGIVWCNIVLTKFLGAAEKLAAPPPQFLP